MKFSRLLFVATTYAFRNTGNTNEATENREVRITGLETAVPKEPRKDERRGLDEQSSIEQKNGRDRRGHISCVNGIGPKFEPFHGYLDS